MLLILGGIFLLGMAMQEMNTGTDWDEPDGGRRSFLWGVILLMLGIMFTYNLSTNHGSQDYGYKNQTQSNSTTRKFLSI